jgi:MFS family permease
LLPALSDRIGRKPVLLMMAAMSAAMPLAYLCPFLYAHRLLLAGVVFVTNTGQGIAALIMVLVPTESVPPQFRATSIGVATLVGEIFGATAAPLLAGLAAERYGLGVTMWMAAAGGALVFVVALFLKEPLREQAVFLVTQEVKPALT